MRIEKGVRRMSFKGLNFIYDGTPSEVYGLVITKMGDGEENIPGGSEVEPVTDKTFRSPVFQCFGVEQKKPLSFDIEFFCQREFDRFDLSAILLWLCGHTTYCELQICQNDLRNFYYNCLLLDPEVLYFDNKARGIRCKAECDAPWAWEYPRTEQYSFPASTYKTSNEIKFLNLSNDHNDTLPKIKFKMSPQSTSFKIINHDYNDLSFEWTGLQGGETIECDCQTGIITSSTGLRRLKNFNKKFLKLISGMNHLECVGNVDLLEITYTPVRRVGG